MYKLFTYSQQTAGDSTTQLVPGDGANITHEIAGLRVQPQNPGNVEMLGNPHDETNESWITMESNEAFDFPLDPLPRFRDTGTQETIKFTFLLKRW